MNNPAPAHSSTVAQFRDENKAMDARELAGHDDRPGWCRCCHQAKLIPRNWHICRECFVELEEER